ncbi:hypothetical protein BH09MYX1_BH09MYX1_01420 [soil metagenome]
MKSVVYMFFVALVALVALGCVDTSKPEDPVWGKQACGHCAMLVSDPRFAAQLTTKDDNRVFFDDVGCMAAYVKSRHLDVRAMWVRDELGHWIDARTAHFERGEKTPMDYGFVATSGGSASFGDVELVVDQRENGGAR